MWYVNADRNFFFSIWEMTCVLGGLTGVCCATES
jgi:hypothetical protein